MSELDQALAFWVSAPGVGELRREPLRRPEPGEVRVRTLYSGISRGTETLVFSGRVPASEHERMRAPFQEGQFPAPVKYGYISVGVVEAGPAELEGREVFCLYPHQTRYVVPAQAVHPLPAAVPAARAVLGANLETAVNGLWDSAPRVGDRITVIGAGTVGCLVAWLAGRIPGCEVELVDNDPGKRAVAERLGVGFAAPETARTEADRVVHCSGAPEGLATALRLAGLEASVVEMSWFGDRAVPLPLGEAFHSRRLRLRSSQVGEVARCQRPRWSPRRRMALALSLLADPTLECLIDAEHPFAELPAVMARLAREPSGALCHRIRYPP